MYFGVILARVQFPLCCATGLFLSSLTLIFMLLLLIPTTMCLEKSIHLVVQHGIPEAHFSVFSSSVVYNVLPATPP